MRHIPYATSILVVLGGGWVLYMSLLAVIHYLYIVGFVVLFCACVLCLGMTVSKLRATLFMDKNGIAPVKRVAARKPRD